MRAQRLFFVVLLVASACSSAPSEQPPEATIVRAAERARAAGTVRFSSTISVPLAGATRKAVLTGSGAIDFTHHLATTTVDVRQLLAVFRARRGAPASFTFLFALGSFYVKLEPPRNGKQWARIATSVAVSTNPFAQLGGSDPSTMIDALRGVREGATKEGRETVAGISTTAYRVSLDLARAGTLGGAAIAAALRAEFRTATTISARVWIDARGRPAQEILTFGGASGETTVQRTFTDYGAPVRIATPPATQVLILKDAAALGALFQQALTGKSS